MKHYPTQQIKTIETHSGGGATVTLLDDSELTFDPGDSVDIAKRLQSSNAGLMFPEPTLETWVPGDYAAHAAFGHVETDPDDASTGELFRWRVLQPIAVDDFADFETLRASGRVEREGVSRNVKPVPEPPAPRWKAGQAYAVGDLLTYFETDPADENVGVLFRWRVVTGIAETEFTRWDTVEFAIQGRLERLAEA